MERQNKSTETRGFRAIAMRTTRAILNTTVTFGVIAGAVFAVRYGATELAQRADAAPTPATAPAIPVAASPLRLQPGYDVRRAFTGQVEAQRSVALSFELPGRLESVDVEEGDTVAAGQVLARQDTALLSAERNRLMASKAATEAQLKFAVQTVERSEELRDRGFAPQSGLDEALARRDELVNRIAEIEAAIANVDIRIEKSEVKAPFAGRVTSRNVDGGEALNPGQTVLGLVALAEPQIRVGIPLDFDASDLADSQVELESGTVEVRLASLRPDIDPVTRTRTALFDVIGDASLTFGETARLILSERVEASGFWLPLTSLKEGVRGQWTVLTVDSDNMVRSAPVEVLHAETERVYVRAAFADGTPLIDQGPQRVTTGQQVDVSLSE